MKKKDNVQIYSVGGAVRDALLGLPVKDNDYVVVGASPEWMLSRRFKPVGKDFPVFLHPDTHEEYALARTERKTGHGYQGFSFHAAPEVSLEEDLGRRDLTINAIARSTEGALIDPFDGQRDLQEKTLRHVGPAFSEDPVRILRLARFAARFVDFTVAPETLVLMQEMVRAGEVDYLVPERIWQELAKGLMEARPSRMLQVLRSCGALARLLPEVDQLYGVPQRKDYHPEVDTGAHVEMALDYSAAQAMPLPVRFAVLLHDLGKALTPATDLPRHPGHEARGIPLVQLVCDRWKVPSDSRDLALLMVRYHGDIRRSSEMRADTLVRLLEKMDAIRRPERFEWLLLACDCDFRGRLGWEAREIPDRDLLPRLLNAVKSVDARAVAASCADKGQIAAKMHQARVTEAKKMLR